jgi:FkbM family methyltransferase
MFELINKKYTFKEFPERELNVWGRKDTLDFKLLDGVAEYKFNEINYNDGDAIIDIGAYTGQEMLYFAAQGLNLVYLAFEPIIENFRILDLNIKDNAKCLDIDWADNAVGDGIGKIEMYLGGEGEGKWRNLYRYMGNIKPPFRSQEHRTVFQITLDYIFEATKIKKCKVMKIDCEGAEHRILRAASKETLDKIQNIVGEVHEEIKVKDLLKATRGRFKVVWEDDHLFRFIHK